VKASEFASRIGPLAATGPFRVESQPDAAGGWELFETYAQAEDAYDALQRLTQKTRRTPLRIVNSRGNAILQGSGRQPVPLKHTPAFLLGMAAVRRFIKAGQNKPED
jgi:hypothetical protein